MADSMVDSMAESDSPAIEIAAYLFTRLKQLGVDSIHGVPGDYNLVALDYIDGIGLKWVGNCNELNAGYAADGYARVKGISAIVTTFGVGELSAMNAIAGAFSEKVPIVHIVGTPSTVSQKNGMMLHHTLGNGDFNVFSDMNKEISCAIAKINIPSEAAAQIDNVLRQCWIKSQPVYITLPTDMVRKKVDGQRLRTPIDLSPVPNDEAREDYAVDVVLKYLHAAKNPAILLDACTIRHRVVEEVHALAEKTKLPVFVTPMGKGAMDETNPNYAGVYAGEGSQPDVKERLESSDLILSVGAVKSDFNTGGFTYKTSQLNTIDFHSTHMTVRYSEYPHVGMRGVLSKVTQKVDLNKLSALPGPKVNNEVKENLDSSPTITQAWFWPRVGEFLKKNDIVITETGTSNFGIWDTKFPSGVTAISQVLWGSIGYSVGACQGAALAARDAANRDAGSNRRTILFVGDGSLQLTAQEISTMIRLGLNPIIFCICNDGYTIERFIHGMEAKYNDIQEWRYKDLLHTFGATKDATKAYQVKTKEDVDALFRDEAFNDAQKLQFVEVYMQWDDAPRALKIAAEASARNNDRN